MAMKTESVRVPRVKSKACGVSRAIGLPYELPSIRYPSPAGGPLPTAESPRPPPLHGTPALIVDNNPLAVNPSAVRVFVSALEIKFLLELDEGVALWLFGFAILDDLDLKGSEEKKWLSGTVLIGPYTLNSFIRVSSVVS